MADISLATVRLLVVEDSDIDAELLSGHLAKADLNFAIERVFTRHTFEDAVARGGIDVILADYSLPDFDGLTALGIARQRLPDTPFIFVSGVIGEEFATNALRRGATDYILKRNLSRVPTAISRALADARQVVERRQALAALHKSEQDLRIALAAGRFGTWTLDLATRDLTTSNTCRTNFGRDPQQPFTYEELLAAVHPDDQARMRAAVEASLTGQRDYDIEYRIVTPAKEIRWISVRGQPTYADDGAPLSMTGVSSDITERKYGEIRRIALVELGDRIRDTESQAHLAFAAAEILGRTLEVSRAGYGTVDPASETITIERDWTAPGIRTLAGTLRFRDYGSYIENLKRGETVVFSDARLDPRTTASAAALEAISARSVVNMPIAENGGFVALLYLNHETVRDWTASDLAFVREVADRTRTAVERLRVKDELAALANSLERLVEERTAALTEAEEQLRQSQKMEAIGQLTGGIAHDFNNLLTGITGSLAIIKRRISSGRLDDIDRFMDAASGSAQRAAALTHRLLAFSRRQSLDTKPQDVNALIGGMEELLRRTLGENIQLEAALAMDLPSALADGNQLENALLNLAINARDAMPDGGVLTVKTGLADIDEKTRQRNDEPRAGRYVVVTVADTGVGMAEDVLTKAFEPFYTTKPIGQGTGLGLSMIYGFAKQSGGFVRLESKVDIGTTVSIYLPQAPSEAVQPVSHDRTAPPGGDGEMVLVVEDDQNVRLLITQVLEELGYGCMEAPDGATAIPLLQSKRAIDLMISDVGLPNMNGRQLAEIARQSRPDLKILFVTGYAEKASARAEFLASGMDMMTKPFTLDELGAKVKEMIAAEF